jgi:peptidoglycan/LPS O-acetylase OafA/YrhL
LGTEGRRTGRIGALDGLRALAVVAVLCFHSQFSWAKGGFLGVSLFFTLSGYLITTLLLDEHERNGTISLRSFWARRARRLLPAAWIALAGVVVFGATVATADQLRSLRGDVFGAFAYVANWRFYFSGRSYEQLFSAPSPLLHFWSLAIEEQFYIFFPVVLLAVLMIARGRRAVIAAFFVAGIAASVAAGLLLGGGVDGQSRVYYGTDTRAAELLVGALLALVLHRMRSRATDRGRRVATFAGPAALLVLAVLWVTTAQTASWLYHGGFALHAAIAATLIAAVLVDSPLSRALSWQPFVMIGLLSYGIYLFHWPVFLWLTPDRTGLAAAPLFVVRVTVTGALAYASYRLIEQPVLTGRRLTGRRPRFAMITVGSALLIALAAVTWSPPRREIVLAALGDRPASASVRDLAPLTNAPPTSIRVGAKTAAATPPSKPVSRVLVVGDSVGLTLGRGIELWARSHPGLQVLNKAQIYCPLGRDLEMLSGYVHASTNGCNWTTRWPQVVQSFRPDLTIVLFTVWEAAPRKLPGAGWQSPGNAAYDQWQRREYGAAAQTLSAGGGRIVWLRVPCSGGVPVNPGSSLWTVNTKAIDPLTGPRSPVRVLDLNPQICPTGKPLHDYDGVRNFRPDGTHFSDAGALAVANWLMPQALSGN